MVADVIDSSDRDSKLPDLLHLNFELEREAVKAN
jgi:hypothetical protein